MNKCKQLTRTFNSSFLNTIAVQSLNNVRYCEGPGGSMS